jgi:hypothetical protein
LCFEALNVAATFFLLPSRQSDVFPAAVASIGQFLSIPIRDPPPPDRSIDRDLSNDRQLEPFRSDFFSGEQIRRLLPALFYWRSFVDLPAAPFR